MSDQDQNDTISNVVKHALQSVFERELTQEEFYYLLSRYPYLEICDTDNHYLDETQLPKIITTHNGWKIYDYGNAVFAGGSELMSMVHRKKLEKQKEEEGGDSGEVGGFGTIVQQYADVAFQVIDLIKARGWGAVEILAGFYSMKRVAWIAAELNQLKVTGFEPTLEDYVVFGWVSKLKNGRFYPHNKPISPQL